MKPERPRNIIAFDASGHNYGRIIFDAAPPTWEVARFDERGEEYAIEDLQDFRNPVVIASLAFTSFAYDLYSGKVLIDTAQNLSIPTAVIADVNMEDRLRYFSSVTFIPRVSGAVSENLQNWFASLRTSE